jgi:hypothetical protein
MFAFIPQRVFFLSMLAGIFLGLGPGHAARGANPNARDPLLSLEIHNLLEAEATRNKADALFQSLFKDLRAISSNPARVAGKKLSDLHAQLSQLQRAAIDLQLHGETAGVDYAQRAKVLSGMFSKIVSIFQGTPAGQVYVAKAQQYLGSPRAVQERRTTAAKVQKLMQQEKWEEAFTALHQSLDQVASLTVFMEPRLAESFLAEFAPFQISLLIRRNKAFREQAQSSLEQLAAAELPQTQQCLQAIAAAAATLRTAPQADVGGQTLAGPECLAHFGELGRQLQLSAVRCRAIEWARISAIPDLTYLPRVEAQQIQLSNDVIAGFYDQFATGLAALIEADAQRAAEAEVPELYVRYLQALAPLVADTADGKLQAAVQPALEKLANKSAVFAQEVQAYRTATQELLRWRERLAQTRAASAAAGCQTSDAFLLDAFTSKGEFYGLFAATEAASNQATLLTTSCPQVILATQERILDKPLLLNNLVGLKGGKLAVARYRARHYATLPLPDVDAEITRLNQELLVTAQQPALTLDTTAALASARRGDYARVGGAVKNFHLEGLIPRFATLRPEIQQLVPLGPLPDEAEPTAFVSHVLVRWDVEPDWVQHRYFFAELPRPEAP